MEGCVGCVVPGTERYPENLKEVLARIGVPERGRMAVVVKAPGCPRCDALLKSLSGSDFGGSLVSFVIVDGAGDVEAADALEVSSVPALLLVEDMEVVYRMDGEVPPAPVVRDLLEGFFR